MNLELENINQLYILHAAILELKFDENISHNSLNLSPFLSETSNKIIEKLIELSSNHPDYGTPDQLNAWRNLTPDRSEWKVVESYIIQNSEYWSKCDFEEKNKFIDIIISPFIIEDKHRNQLLSL